MDGKGEMKIIWPEEAKVKLDYSQTIGNTAPAGLWGFAIVLTMLGAINAGLVDPDFGPIVWSYFLAIGSSFIPLGYLEFSRNNILTGTILFTYGPFGAGMAIFQLLAYSGAIKPGNLSAGLVTLFTLYAFVSFLFLCVAIRFNVAMCSTFVGVILLLLCLAGSSYGSVGATRASGWLSLITAATAFYGGSAPFINELWGREVLPAGDLTWVWAGKQHGRNRLASVAESKAERETLSVPAAAVVTEPGGDKAAAWSQHVVRGMVKEHELEVCEARRPGGQKQEEQEHVPEINDVASRYFV
ncbi:hypothetical protein M427DRAFT_35461 [Gonapodya prolifera JEL478]|uniref:Uncharacterized protein n=1 Tax=Gonapodya prolifera (strain JEL478) TaxID=1344416 RepID=A0A139A4Q1_GONPJ|nr:hypothetical protein M427DRAFT_35461 [Gonapodya prolifera JEL478]|eukprot:KXS11714.1 hypothetical protein M427DRAFT_35461 [Gonapodya prolifera JEL478]